MKDITSYKSNKELSQFSLGIFNFCKTIAPQFYKNMTEEDIKLSIESIKMLLGDIDDATIKEMLNMAVKGYKVERSTNDKTYFDANYILKFYKAAFNKIHCDSVKVLKPATKIHENYDHDKGILFQTWEDAEGVKDIACIQAFMETSHQYSPKDYEQAVINTVDEIEKLNL